MTRQYKEIENKLNSAFGIRDFIVINIVINHSA
jgi:hypothetical protein